MCRAEKYDPAPKAKKAPVRKAVPKKAPARLESDDDSEDDVSVLNVCIIWFIMCACFATTDFVFLTWLTSIPVTVRSSAQGQESPGSEGGT